MYGYFAIAKKYNIFDKPNERSSHRNVTIRGGGIVLVIALLSYYFLFFDVEQRFFIIAIALLGIVSFIDDINSISYRLRILTHSVAISLIFHQFDFFLLEGLSNIFIIICLYIVVLGFLNIYNFMDGINGITFLNALLTYVSLFLFNTIYISFIDSRLLSTLIISISIFGIFNFRRVAICFAGDVGSITIGFSIIYLIFLNFFEKNNPLIFLLIMVYLIDGGWTIIQRLIRGQNIFKAHRNHLYQLLSNDLNFGHLKVSSIYFFVQAIINSIVILLWEVVFNKYIIVIIFFIALSLIYFFTKYKVKVRIKMQYQKNK